MQDESAIISGQSVSIDGFVFAEPGESLLAETPEGPILEVDDEERRVVCASFEDYLAGAARPPPASSEESCWAVQLMFATQSEAGVRATLGELLGLRFTPNWTAERTSPAGVVTFKAPCANLSQPGFAKMEYPGWTTPIFVLNQSVEPSRMREFRRYFRTWSRGNIGFKLVNYGVLPRYAAADT
jgi:hypothetical protein